MAAAVRPNCRRCCLLCFHSASPRPANTGPFAKLRQALVNSFRRDTGSVTSLAVLRMENSVEFAYN